MSRAFAVPFVLTTSTALAAGMNWHHLPELSWQFGYLYFWMVCAGVTIIVLAFMQYLGMLFQGRDKPLRTLPKPPVAYDPKS